jgi:protein TonB
MDAITEPPIERLTSSDESTRHGALDSDGDGGGEAWVDPADAEQIGTAVLESQSMRRRNKKDWQVAFVAALLLHAFGVVAIAEIAAHFNAMTHWRLARGNPLASGGTALPGSMQREDSGFIEQNSIVLPPIPATPAENHHAAMDQLEDKSSVLAEMIASPMPEAAEAVIGIGPDNALQKLPHFASTQPGVRSAALLAMAGAGLVAGPTTPPRVAGGGGKRGERDGIDSRGLPIPDYPAESRLRGEEGVVMIDVEVLSDGTVGSVRIISDAGHPRLAMAAAEAIKSATFEPARVDGKPVVGHILIPYRFMLE